eukprot:6608889-Prymnesium_polylepis.2
MARRRDGDLSHAKHRGAPELRRARVAAVGGAASPSTGGSLLRSASLTVESSSISIRGAFASTHDR